MKEHLLIPCGDTIYVLRPGVGWGGCHLTDMSYYTPPFFRIFAEITGDTIWKTLAEDSYEILHAAAHESTGLVPDWQAVSGEPGGDPPQPDRIGYYRYDASRTPWRIGLDHLWNGDSISRDWCTKVSDWAYGVGPTNIVDGYLLDGTPQGQYHNSAFVGGFTIGAMCNSQIVSDEFGARLKVLNDQHYFNLSVRNLYLLTATGNLWKPETEFSILTDIEVNGEDGKDFIDADHGTLQMFAEVYPDTTYDQSVSWSVVNVTGAASISETGLLTALADGTVRVVATANDPGLAKGELEITLSNQTALVEEIIIDYEGSAPTIWVRNGTLQLSARVLPEYADNKNVSWEILSGNDLAEISDSGLVTALADGQPVVRAIASDGSGVTGELVVYIFNQSTGITSQKDPGILIFPNPVNSTLTIGNAVPAAKFEIINSSGATAMILEEECKDRISIDISQLDAGVYLLKAMTRDGTVSRIGFIKL